MDDVPGAIEPLRALAGAPLLNPHQRARGLRARTAELHAPVRPHGLAVAHASREAGGSRTYDVNDPGPATQSHRPELHRDGKFLFRWQIAGRTIIGPPPFEQVSLRGGFHRVGRGAPGRGHGRSRERVAARLRHQPRSRDRLDIFETADMLGDPVRARVTRSSLR